MAGRVSPSGGEHDRPQPILKADGLSKRYEDGVLALDNLNLEVRPGEIYACSAPTGRARRRRSTSSWASSRRRRVLPHQRPSTSRKTLSRPRSTCPSSPRTSCSTAISRARQNLDFFARLGGRENLTKSDYARAMRRVSLQEKAFDQRVKNFSRACAEARHRHRHRQGRAGRAPATSRRRAWTPRRRPNSSRSWPSCGPRASRPHVDPRHLPGQGESATASASCGKAAWSWSGPARSSARGPEPDLHRLHGIRKGRPGGVA